jgi:hypothetical protein
MRALFRLRRSKSFPRGDVEKRGYMPGSQNEDPSLAMMIRSLLMPKRFAYGMSPDEEAGCLRRWPKGIVCCVEARRVGMPLF